MINNIFKSLFLIAFIAFVIILYGIYDKISYGVGRYVPTQSGIILDTKTGNKYVWEEDEGFSMFNNNGQIIKVKSLPR
ncbi:MAG TPA: hypothetical protein VK541_24820 [Pedobacter sp.]|uniref:hypothetical protein n=1 Tax=Pedobacter sp. TaxID=1411316 RepID=UPI002B6EBD59|nr:hypothetical protein [Pedobacter sp.]HMI05735.1 hypothetical protein [Pedobacter sp.]